MASSYHFYRRLIEQGPRSAGERLIFLVLVVASRLFGLLVVMRQFAYSTGIAKSYRASIPVLSVGNLTVGGTGKTPVVDHLVQRALMSGQRVAVVSRGYGGQRKSGTALVSDGRGTLHDDAYLYGDEPVLLARRNRDAMVIVARKRSEGVMLAEKLGAELVILDDGFQHRALSRDFDIVLLDSRSPFGNGHLLPAGPLREPVASLARADLVILTHNKGADLAGLDVEQPVLFSSPRFSDTLTSLQGETYSWDDVLPLRCVAFAGIARPETFFAALREKGVLLTAEIALLDHQDYSGDALKDVREACKDADLCLTTEKDAVKLAPEDFPVPCWQVPLTIEINPEPKLNELLETFLQGNNNYENCA